MHDIWRFNFWLISTGRISRSLGGIVLFNDDIRRLLRKRLLRLPVQKRLRQWKRRRSDWENSSVTSLPEQSSISTPMQTINSTFSNSILVYKSSILRRKWSLESTFLRRNCKSQWDCRYIESAISDFSTASIPVANLRSISSFRQRRVRICNDDLHQRDIQRLAELPVKILVRDSNRPVVS